MAPALPASAQSNSAAAYTWTTLAGYPGIGSADGVGAAAQFYGPRGVTVDTNGNLYIVDRINSTIRKLTPAGLVTTIAGSPGFAGSVDGIGAAARFNWPSGIAADSSGTLYVTDQNNYVIRKLTASGTNWSVSTIAGLSGSAGLVDGTNSGARFNSPAGIAVDGNGNLFVTDQDQFPSSGKLRKVAKTGTNWIVTTIATLGGGGFGGGLGGLTVDRAGNVYVANTSAQIIQRVSPAGPNWSVSTIAGTGSFGSSDGMGTNASFYDPADIAIDSATNLYVADKDNYSVRKLSPQGTDWVVATLAGQANHLGFTDGTGTNALFFSITGIAVDRTGTIYVTDYQYNTVRAITSVGVVRTIAGTAGSAGSADGTGAQARFDYPWGVAIGASGTLYVGDSGNRMIREITPIGVVSTIAGSPGAYGSTDGPGSFARFGQPTSIAVDSNETMYVTDAGNHTVRKISPPGLVTTIAGLAGAQAFADGTNSVARFSTPLGIAAESNGTLYVADTGNSVIRKLVPAGTNWVVTTIAGLAGASASVDGTGTNARFGSPWGVATDGRGNLFVADAGSSYTVRKLSQSGTNWVVSTIAGLAGFSGTNDGLGSAARFSGPYNVAVDGAGNVYVADSYYIIRRLTPSGTNWLVTSIGGMGNVPGSADGAGSAARFYSLVGIGADAAGNVYVADSQNNTIRKGVFNQFTAANPAMSARPAQNARLMVALQPSTAGGQWRFPWEYGWRTNGQTVSNLVAGNYPVQFRPVPDWLAIPSSVTIGVTNNGLTPYTNQYYPTIASQDTNSGNGSLTVLLGPSPPPGAGWRFVGDTSPFLLSGVTTNLLAGTYLIEFSFVAGRAKPPNLSVQVAGGANVTISQNYLLAQIAPAAALLPQLVASTNITNSVNWPFAFAGQLQSDAGYGSGAAVQPNVVLTACHLVFNDQTLSYVSQVYWASQEDKGAFEPLPLLARGWYVLGGYAAQRTNDLQIYAPDVSTPQSRNLDAAALYFLSPVAGGGYGGFLPSDANPNPWLTGNALKMLVGYPVDGSLFGDASITPGKMYQTTPQPFALGLAPDPLSNQEVYTAPWLFSYPGNSGGPFYVQFNGYYYPAGIYLGTLFNGIQPYASAIRAIDSQVASLITNAAALGDTGTNNTGGGVITFIPDANLSVGNPAYIQVSLGPTGAVQAGAGWRLHGDSTYGTAANYTRAVTTNGASIEFKPIMGWDPPTNRTVQLVAGQVTVVPNVLYTLAATQYVSPSATLGLSGYAGGPINPLSFAYTLTNAGQGALTWTASLNTNWLSLSPTGGTLVGFRSTNINVSFTSNAFSLPIGVHNATVNFNNQTNGLGTTTRSASLTLLAHPAVTLSNISIASNGSVTVTINGLAGRSYAILASTNLLASNTLWSGVTNVLSSTRFTLPGPPGIRQRFYRALEQ